MIGNPSDGFYGKTISFTISNFWAEVTITESSRLVSHTHFTPLHICLPPTHTHTLVDNVQITILLQASISIHENSSLQNICQKTNGLSKIRLLFLKLQNLPMKSVALCTVGRFANFSPLRCVYELPYTPGTTARAIRISRMTGWSTAVRI